MRGTWKEGSFVGASERYVKEIYQERCKNALQMGLSLHRGPIGEAGEDSLAGTFW